MLRDSEIKKKIRQHLIEPGCNLIYGNDDIAPVNKHSAINSVMINVTMKEISIYTINRKTMQFVFPKQLCLFQTLK